MNGQVKLGIRQIRRHREKVMSMDMYRVYIEAVDRVVMNDLCILSRMGEDWLCYGESSVFIADPDVDEQLEMTS